MLLKKLFSLVNELLKRNISQSQNVWMRCDVTIVLGMYRSRIVELEQVVDTQSLSKIFCKERNLKSLIESYRLIFGIFCICCDCQLQCN